MSKPVVKYMAIGTFSTPMTPEQAREYMPREVPATLQMYLDGTMEQFWMREDRQGVVFLMTTETKEEAAAMLKALPLGRAGLLHFELIPIVPLAPLGQLMGLKLP